MPGSSIGRRLYGSATLWLDWDRLSDEEGEAKYWELFSDLLMVAAASSLADNLKDDVTSRGLLEFFLLYSAIVNTWFLYTHHYTARFEENSLMHSALLFPFLLGMAVSIVNAKVETARAFSCAVVVQRLAILSMLFPIWFQMPRARDHITVLLCVTIFTGLCFAVPIIQPEWAEWAWAAAAVIDWNIEFIMVLTLPGRKLLPANINHSKERLGVLVLVMLGETVISATVSYREEVMEVHDKDKQNEFYTVLILAFLLIFMFCLLYFNVQPPVDFHAFRRSRFAGCMLFILNKALGGTLLCVGVCIKLAIQNIVEEKEEEEAAVEHDVAEEESSPSLVARFLAIAVGSSMLLLFGMRLTHYGGRIPRPSDPPNATRLFWTWWVILGVFSILPFFFARLKSFKVALAVQSGLLVSITVVETWFTHVLEKYLPSEEEDEEAGEESALVSGGKDNKTYQAAG